MRRNWSAAVLAAGLLGACSQEAQPLSQTQLIERGEYLVNSVVLCDDCHTPRLQTGEQDRTHRLQGGPNMTTPTVEMPWGDVVPSIAGVPAQYAHEQFVAFLQTGVRPDGSHARPPMPPYRLNEEDARAVAAYIATLPREPE